MELRLFIDSVDKRDDAVSRGNEVNGALFEVAEPGRKGLWRIHSGRKKHELDGRIQENHSLFPDGAPVLVVDIVTLVKYDGIQTVQREGRCDAEGLCGRPTLEQEISEDFSGHDDDVRVRLVFEVAGHDAHTARKEFLEVVELLVAEGLDGGRIEYAPTFAKTVRNLIFADESFPGARFRRDEDIGSGRNRSNGLLLEGVKRECVCLCRICRKILTGLGTFLNMEEGRGHLVRIYCATGATVNFIGGLTAMCWFKYSVRSI